MAKATISLRENGCGSVHVGGVDVSSVVCSVSITARPGHGTTATLDCLAGCSAEADHVLVQYAPTPRTAVWRCCCGALNEGVYGDESNPDSTACGGCRCEVKPGNVQGRYVLIETAGDQ